MIKKLRKQIIATIMTVFCILLFIILVSTYFSTKQTLEGSCWDKLESAIYKTYSNRSPLIQDTSLPILVVTVDYKNNIKLLVNDIDYLSTEDINSLVHEVLTSKSKSSVIDGNLRFLRKSIGISDIRIAIADIQTEQALLKKQLWQLIIIAVISIVTFGILSIILSDKLTKPVHNTILAQKDFVANASHKLKTPLTVILSNTEMLLNTKDSADKTDSSSIQRLNFIHSESLRMKELIEQLLMLAKLDSSTLPVHKEKLDFSFLVCNSVLTYEPFIYDLGKKLDFNYTENIIVLGNAESLRQVIDILLDNAIKYSMPESTIKITLTAQKRNVLLSVESYGTPFSTDDMKRIFQKFYRIGTDSSGYGLGLSIAQSIVEEHSGRIWAETDGISTNKFIVMLDCDN
ncbi:HAMP domain-containing histidine kinase [Faecalicatena sp. AGMB00832]|uniref:histidine kinase n=1 Tax=Faecalicatena faecalis TaxID=2726362 RepID=A0ABS6D4X9_9FIRM|nr:MULTISPECIES: HAMP domain-containing sensor histidine kinase [Faecalicatena]MBU3876652.1 HAMP domain-containing histidine kinase [Faecalicatena faecalis]MCI6464707.1 HAMP domain-containing histidine kinase [Faecalicatena sp.]MDY5618285.1 HAMP domain-containing sensor histidine kinase [Lachnospiraceae bacterium]